MNVSIVIPNYNGESLLKKNLPAVFAAAKHYTQNSKSAVEVIVIDDASRDNSKDVLEEFAKQAAKETISFSVEIKEKNEGFSPTVNRGVKKAKGDLIMLLNTDVYPQEDFLLPLVKHFLDEKVFAVGMMDKSIEQGHEVLRGRGVGQWKRGFFIHAAGKLDKDTTLWVNGGSGMFRKKIWDTLGGLDELYKPFYWEDIDVSYRALKSGYTIVFERKSTGIHEHERGAIKSKYAQSDIQKISYRNQFIFVWKNADKNTLSNHIVWLPYHFIKALFRADINFFAGFFNACGLLLVIFQHRKIQQKQFIFSDYDIIARFRE
jgi:GT2 family glycosyltransferase